MRLRKLNSIVISLFVIFLLVLTVPSRGLNLYVATDKVYYSASDDFVTFTIDLDLETNEKIPLQNLTLNITGPTNVTCVFSPGGEKLSGCGDIANITLINNAGYSYGFGSYANASGSHGYAHDSGTSYFFHENESFYGYGYVEGYEYALTQGSELKYNITWNITNALDGSYTAELSALADDGTNSHVFTSGTNASFLLDTVVPSPRIIKPSNDAEYAEGTSVLFMGNINGEANVKSFLWNSSIDGNLDTSNSFITSSLSIGTHTVTFFLTDDANQTGQKSINVTLTGTLFGNASTVTSNYGSLNVTVNSSAISSDALSGVLPVVFMNGTQNLVEFNYNFSVRSLNLTAVTVNDTSNSTTGSVLVQGIDLTNMNFTKTAYMQRVDASINGICVKDTESASVSNISSGCSESDETKVECDGTIQEGYSCTYNSTSGMYTITGLEHSAIKQIDYTQNSGAAGSSTGSLGSSGGSSGGGGILDSVADEELDETQEGDESATPSPQAPEEFDSEIPATESRQVPLGVSLPIILTAIAMLILTVKIQKTKLKKKREDEAKEKPAEDEAEKSGGDVTIDEHEEIESNTDEKINEPEDLS